MRVRTYVRCAVRGVCEAGKRACAQQAQPRAVDLDLAVGRAGYNYTYTGYRSVAQRGAVFQFLCRILYSRSVAN